MHRGEHLPSLPAGLGEGNIGRIADSDPTFTPSNASLCDEYLGPSGCDAKAEARKLTVEYNIIPPGNGRGVNKSLGQALGH
jgi:hypothetical protein